jgi:lipopolysaccharide export LptBFGC system permease protein LptF
VAPNTINRQVGHIIDLLPTFLDLAGRSYPSTFDGHPIEPVEGISLLPLFEDRNRAGHDTLYWEWAGNRAVRQAFQMSWGELRHYIDGLQRAGFDVSTLKVQWHKKIAYPLIAPISMLLAIPFGLLVGNRGAIGGVALGVGIGISYWAVAALLEALGGIGQLPPLLAGWSPDLIFLFLGMYFLFKMPT